MLSTTTPLVDPQMILVLVGGVLAIGAGAGFWNWIISRKKTPIDARTAEAAASEQLGNLALSIAKAADERSARLENRVNAQDNTIRELQDHSREQGVTIDRLVTWGRSIIDDWHQVRLNPDPPAMPVTEIIHHTPEEG